MREPWNLSTGPLLRTYVYTKGAADELEPGAVVLFTAHHIALDGWSLDIVLRDLGAFYDNRVTRLAAKRRLVGNTEELGFDNMSRGGECSSDDEGDATLLDSASEIDLSSSSVSMVTLAHDQAQKSASAEWSRLWAYWQRQLAGLDATVLKLPTDRPRPPVMTYAGAAVKFQLSHDLTTKLRRFVRADGATLFMTLLAAFKVLLFRYSGQVDLLVGTPMACRVDDAHENLVGRVANLVVLRSAMDGDKPFRDFLREVKRTVIDGFMHQEFPFALLLERVARFRDPAHTPLFQVRQNALAQPLD